MSHSIRYFCLVAFIVFLKNILAPAFVVYGSNVVLQQFFLRVTDWYATAFLNFYNVIATCFNQLKNLLKLHYFKYSRKKY